MTKNCMYSIPCSCCKVYRGKACCPLKVRLEEHRKAECSGEVKKSGMADPLWKEKGNHLPLWDEVRIIDWEEHWRIQHLKEAAHMLGYNGQLKRLNIKLDEMKKNIATWNTVE